jgi:MYXO-CTERM domain-containing protein
MLTCTVGALALAGAATLTVILQPGTSSASHVSFVAQSSSSEVDPGDGTLSFALNQPGEPADTDGPLPPWALAGLGILLAGLATRRRAA